MGDEVDRFLTTTEDAALDVPDDALDWPPLPEVLDEGFYGALPLPVTRATVDLKLHNMRELRRVGESVQADLTARLTELQSVRAANGRLRELAERGRAGAEGAVQRAEGLLAGLRARVTGVRAEVGQGRERWLSSAALQLQRLEVEPTD